MEYQVSEEMGLVIVRVGVDPRLADLDNFFEQHLGQLVKTGKTRLISDLRRLNTSELDAAKLRARMARADTIVRENLQPGTGLFRMVALAKPGTLGQGMARMMVGQKWGLSGFELAVCESIEGAGECLGLPPDWNIQIGFS